MIKKPITSLIPRSKLNKKDVDRSLIRENLRLSIEERFEKLMRLQQFAEELRRAGRGSQEPW